MPSDQDLSYHDLLAVRALLANNGYLGSLDYLVSARQQRLRDLESQ